VQQVPGNRFFGQKTDKPVMKFVPVFAVAALLLAGPVLLSGCYTLKQGLTLFGYLGRAMPLEKIPSESQESPESEKNQRFVEQVKDIRRFAMDELGLKESKNYTKYVRLDRDYLAAVVSAAAKDSFTRHEWWFPVVGKMPYKGFFDPKDARKEAARLEKKDLDVWIRRVDAFSTLGWFRDPLYSYMRDYPAHELADLIIHELLHATVYLKGQGNFNEELAEFVGAEGSRLYIIQKYGPDSAEFAAMTNSKTDGKAFVGFIQELIAELDVLYKAGRDREDTLRQKEAIIKAARERFAAEYDARFTSKNYRGFAELPVNNAYLELFRLYYADDTFYEDLYEKTGRNLRAFIAAAKMVKGKEAGRLQLERVIGK
jgi:predicted aminopeptidase